MGAQGQIGTGAGHALQDRAGSAEGLSNVEVGARCGVEPHTVAKWRARFVEHRLDGLVDEPRPGREPSITADQVEDVVVATLESTPKNATHWSRAKMAERSGLSKSTIGPDLEGLRPQAAPRGRLQALQRPLFVEKVQDVVGLYLDPPESAVVLSVDEKSQVQALSRSQPAFPMMPGMPEKRTHDYVRHGTTSLFAALNVADGTVISSTHRRHRATEFKKFLAKIDAEVPDDLDVHVICDNYGTHKHPIVNRWLEAHPRFTRHFTPTYSSWLNQVERLFAYVTADLLQRSDHRSVQALEKDLREWVKAWNENPRPFVWTKTADQILGSLGRLLNRTPLAQDTSCRPTRCDLQDQLRFHPNPGFKSAYNPFLQAAPTLGGRRRDSSPARPVSGSQVRRRRAVSVQPTGTPTL